MEPENKKGQDVGEVPEVDQYQERIFQLEKAVRRLKKTFDAHIGNVFHNEYIRREVERTRASVPTISCKVPQTYSQHGEDIIVASLLEARRGDAPFANIRYLDIGANHPINMSNTYLLYQKGASGVLVEPNPSLGAEIAAVRPRDKVLPCGVKFSELEEAELLIADQHELSSFSQEFIDDWNRRHVNKVNIIEKVRVPMVDINTIIDDCFGSAPEVLSIDVEGFDYDVLSSLDYTRFRPWLIVVEWSEFYHGDGKEALVSLMSENGYRLIADTCVNGVFEYK